MFEFSGMKVITSPAIQPIPRMQCMKRSEELLSPELVAATNKWMLEFFGTYTPVYFIGNSQIAMQPEHSAMLRAMSRIS